MRKIIITSVFVLICIIGNSQNSKNKPSRKETEDWIIEKLNKYVVKENYHSMDFIDETVVTSKNNIKFKLDNEHIFISSDVRKNTSNRFINVDGIKSETKIYTETTSIPLKNITNKYFIKDGYVFFESNYNSFTMRHSDGYTSTNNWFGAKIRDNEEENFAERFNKAMNHLLSFTKKSKTSEIF